MRIVIGGDDEVAQQLVEALHTDHEVTLVLPEDGAFSPSEHLDALLVRGPATSSSVLRKAQAQRADVFIACTSHDERNLVACVAARRLGAAKTVCFLSRRDFRSSLDDDVELARSLGIQEVVRPGLQLAQEIVRIVSVPGALDVELFAGGKVLLLRHEVQEGAPIAKGSLMDVGVPKGVVLVHCRRDDDVFIPSGATHFRAGDKVTAMGSRRGLNRLLFRYLRASRSRGSRAATVVGGGMVGLAVARGLEDVGWDVKVFERDAQRARQIAPLLDGLVLHGDGADQALLEQEHVNEDSVLIAVTSNDEKNLLVSLMAKEMGVPRIVTRADLPANERLFERVGVDVVRSSQGAAVTSVVRTLVTGRAELLAELEHGDAVVLELVLPADAEPVTLARMRRPVFAIVGAILRSGKVIIPRGEDQLRPGDHILVFCTKAEEDRVRAFFLEDLSEETG